MMKKIYHWTQSGGVRLALIIVLIITALLLALNIIVSYRGENSFVTAMDSIPSTEQTQKFTTLSPNDYLPGEPYQIANLKTPRQLFESHLHTDLIWMTVIGIFISILLGLIVAQQFFTKPLERLQKAINSLKTRNFAIKVEPTGLTEFDQVVHEFNDLAHELARAENLRRDLISDTSHELNTPITAIRAQLEGMKDGLITLDKGRINLLLTQVDRLSNLTERLQEYTRLRNRTANIEREDIPLHSFAMAIIEEIQPQLDKNHIVVTLEIPEESLINADKRLLAELFHNLFNNTVAYAKATRVTIAFRQNKLYFADNGVGVSSEAMPNLFERFFRVEQSRNRKTGGLGLGLAIVKEITEAHEWTITAEHLKPTGLVFIITVPRAS